MNFNNLKISVRLTNLMEEMASAGQAESNGIEEINQAICQMDEITQQNAALVEEAAAASESLQGQAGKLAQMVCAFKVDETLNTIDVSNVARVAIKETANVVMRMKRKPPSLQVASTPVVRRIAAS